MTPATRNRRSVPSPPDLWQMRSWEKPRRSSSFRWSTVEDGCLLTVCDDGESITTESFVPPSIPAPRPWERIAVRAIYAPNKDGRIWKRAGGLLPTDECGSYAACVAELASQGQGARKRARIIGFVRAWGRARWDARAGDPRDGGRDLSQARVLVAEERTAAEARKAELSGLGLDTELATFPDRKLRWLPRKRHNTRWPIDPPKKTTLMLADQQPLLKFKVPTVDMETLEVENTTQQATEKKMRRRSTRRLSRRLTLAPGEELLCAGSGIFAAMSPVKAGECFSSPIKKQLAQSSPIKSCGSSLKPFTIIATPSKVILEPPVRITLSPGKSPLKSPPLSTIAEVTLQAETAMCTESSPCISNPFPVVFNQPAPEVPVEPEHEARRRVSLHNARRAERRSSGIRKPINFEPLRAAPNRRHSSVHESVVLPDSWKRRHTLGVVNCLDAGIREDAALARSESNQLEWAAVDNLAEVIESEFEDAAVDVDVRTNLDIFGASLVFSSSPPRGQQTMRAPAPSISSSSPSRPTTIDTMMASGFAPVGAERAGSENIMIAQEAAEYEAIFEQAATDTKEATTILNAVAGAAVNPPQATYSSPDRNPEEVTFTPFCPQGLSPIIEESIVMDDAMTPLAVYGTSSPATLSPSETRREFKIDQIIQDHHWSWVAEQHVNDNEFTGQPTGSASLPAPMLEVKLETTGGELHTTADCLTGDVLSATVEPETLATECTRQGAGLLLSPVDIQTSSTKGFSDVTPMSGASAANDAVDGLQSPTAARDEAVDEDMDDTSMGDEDSFQDGDFTKTNPIYLESDFTTEADDVDCAANLDGEDEAWQGSSPISATGDHPTIEDIALRSTVERSLMVTLKYLPSTTNITQRAVKKPVEIAVADEVPQKSLSPTAVRASASPGYAQDNIISDKSPSLGNSFKPINRRQSGSPRRVASPPPDPTEGDMDMSAEDLGNLFGETDVTMTVDLDVPPPLDISTTIHDDSDTELLRKFVGRVKADKNAKEAAAARAKLRPKRRSGSTGSTASGSPIARSDTQLPRAPLGQKDANSPSPKKKRKAQHDEGDDISSQKRDAAAANEFNPVSPPKTKRRRKRIQVDNAAMFDPEYQPTLLADSAAPRRSTRARTPRAPTPKQPPTPSSTDAASALCMIPVRLPGSGLISDADMMSFPMPVVRPPRSEERELAAITRVNTRKNKGGAMPPSAVLARHAEDPAGWKLRELKSVFDAREAREESADWCGSGASGSGSDDSKGRRAGKQTRKAKEVRWAEELVRIQGADDGVATVPSKSRGPLLAAALDVEGVETGGVGPEPEAAAVQIALVDMSKVTKAPAMETSGVEAKGKENENPVTTTPTATAAEKTAQPRRTRASKLRAPTPRSSLPASAQEVLAAPPDPTKKTPAKTAPAVRMATRRTKVAGLGMGVNGTPAPKRRATRGIA